MYQDITLKCKECGNDFVFTAGEQEFYAEKGFQNQPKKCRDCRRASKEKPKKEMFSAVCAKCGKEALIPFEPTTDRAIYCSTCFAEMRARG